MNKTKSIQILDQIHHQRLLFVSLLPPVGVDVAVGRVQSTAGSQGASATLLVALWLIH